MDPMGNASFTDSAPKNVEPLKASASKPSVLSFHKRQMLACQAKPLARASKVLKPRFFFYRVGDSMGWWDMELRRKLTNWPGNALIDFDCIILYLIFKWASYVFICLYIISPCFAISLLRFRPFTPHSWGLQVHFNPFHCHADSATPYPESSIGYCTDCWTKLHLPCTDSYHLQDCHCQSWSSWIWDYALIVNWW